MNRRKLQQHLPFTVLKRYTDHYSILIRGLQQHLPFTVLKHTPTLQASEVEYGLQQHLPFTVLKLENVFHIRSNNCIVATAPTVHGIETHYTLKNQDTIFKSCNSTYRSRYWNSYKFKLRFTSSRALQQHLPFTVLKPSSTFMKSSPSSIVATAPTVHGIETYTFWFNQI